MSRRDEWHESGWRCIVLDLSQGLGYNDSAGQVVPSGRWGQANSSRRVLRGGSFNNNHRNARCSYRNNNHPDNEWNNNGCRVGWCAAHDSLTNRRLRGFAPVAGPEMPCVQGCTAAATIDIEERQRGLFLAGVGACGPVGSAKYRIAPSPVVGRIAVGTGSTLGTGHPFGRGSAEGRKARKGVPRIPRFRTSAIQGFVTFRC